MDMPTEGDARQKTYLERPWLKFYPPGLAADLEIPNLSLTEAFDKAAAIWGDRTAIVFYGRKMSFRELKDQIDRLATSLFDLGVRKGDKIALYLLNSPQFVITYFAAFRLGAVVTPISPVYVTPEVRHQLVDSEAKTLICQDILYNFVKNTDVQLERIIMTSIDEYLPTLGKFLGKSILGAVYRKREVPQVKISESKNVYWFQDLIREVKSSPPAVEVSPKEDLAILPYSGGTTGFPKGVMLTHYNVLSLVLAAQTFWSHSSEKGRSLEVGKETLVGYMPFYHIYGQIMALISSMLRGYTLVILTTPDPDDILSSIAKYKATFFLGVPSLYEFLKDYHKTDRVDWKRLKFLGCGADSLLEDTVTGWQRRTGAPIYEGYGSTETSCGMCCTPIGRGRTGSFGIPLPNTIVGIADPEKDEFVPVGDIGELVARGPQIMKGYWNRPEETENSFANIEGKPWFRSGDLVRMDADGYFYFYDRKRDMIKYKGYSIFAREIEEVIKTHPKVKEVAIVGVPDIKVGSNIKAVIVLESDARGKLSEEELMNFCAEHLAHYKVPKIIEFRGEVPRTDVGKVSRRELREEREL